MKDYIQNPFFNFEERSISSKQLSIRRIGTKCLFLSVLSLVVAIWIWSLIIDKLKLDQLSGSIEAWIIFASPFTTIILSAISIKKNQLHPSLSVAFAISVGIFYGSFSAVFDRAGSGIVLNAVACTFITILACLTISIVTNGKISNWFIAFILLCTNIVIGIFIFDFIMSVLFLHWNSILEPSTPISLIVTITGAILGASITIVDFSIIKEISDKGQGKDQEWFFATGILFNLIWIYLCYVFILTWAKRK